jgi:hypothetical protein
MIRLDLSGFTVASFTAGGGFHVVDVSRGGVVCTVARKMLALGVDPAEEIDVRRDGQPAFTRCLTVEWWAARTVVEDGEHGPRFRLLRPTEQPHSANSASYAPNCPKTEPRVSGPSVQRVE